MNADHLLLQASGEILLLLDRQSLRIIAVSPAAYDQLGYAVGSLIDLPIDKLECGLSDLFFWDEMQTRSTPLEAPGRLRRGDGSIVDVKKWVQPTGANNVFYAVRLRPLRGVQRPEVEATDLGLHLAATLEATEDSLLLTDNFASILNMNRRFAELWPLPETLLQERDDPGIVAHIESLLRFDPQQPEQSSVLQQVMVLSKELPGDSFETLYLRDGRVLECFSHPAKNRQRTIGRVFCYRDVTERIAHEKTLQEARDKAEQATLSKGQFLANMSHEIRTPMNAILGMLTLLRGAGLNPRQLDYAHKAEGAAKTLLHLVNDILDFSKIDAGKMTLDLQAFELERLLRDLSVIVSSNLGHRPLDLLFDIDPALPRMLIGDALRLQQVLINLSGNAIKFTTKGQVVVQIRMLGQSGSDITLRVAVRDSGIGIAPEHQKHIFDDFSQAEASTTRRFGGTGLGLSISKRLVALMGGELLFDSQVGQGSTFYFTLTLKAATETTPKLKTEPVRGNLSVLVVDDNALAGELLTNMADSLGWQVDCAYSGAQAIERIMSRAAHHEPPYQAILMDWEMPGMDGWETLAQMHEQAPTTRQAITVMVTSHDRNALAQRSAQEQASLQAFLVKPITAAMMAEAIASAQVGSHNVRSLARQTGDQPGELHGMRLLVVEDNLINQQIANELLTAQGAVVTLADNGALGVAAVAQALQSTPYDAVLMDIQMPVMDGFAATRAIRTDLGLSQLPVIAMTANAMPGDREECLAAGMNEHIGKPFDLRHLVRLLLQMTPHNKPQTSRQID